MAQAKEDRGAQKRDKILEHVTGNTAPLVRKRDTEDPYSLHSLTAWGAAFAEAYHVDVMAHFT